MNKKQLQQQINELQSKLNDSSVNQQWLTEKLFALNQQMKAYEAESEMMKVDGINSDTPTIAKSWRNILENDDNFSFECYIEWENFWMKWWSMINIKHNDSKKNRILKNIFRIAFLYERVGLTIEDYKWKMFSPIKELDNGDIEAYELNSEYTYDDMRNSNWNLEKDEKKKFIVKKNRYAIMDLWNDNMGFIARGGMMWIIKLVYFRRLRDKNASFLSIIADTSNSGRAKTNWITKFNIFSAKDKTNDNNDFYAGKDKQPILGDKIKWFSAGNEVRTTYDLNEQQIKYIEEELNTRFGFPIQSADGKQTLSKESSQFQTTYLNIQKFILEEVNNFIKDSNKYLDTRILFRKNEEFEELNQIEKNEPEPHENNSNATKRDTQSEIDKKTHNPTNTGGNK